MRSTLGDAGYVVFGVVLFVWELLPTSLMVFFFRVRQPDLDRVSQRAPSAIGVVRLGRFRDISPFCCVVCVRRVLQSGTGLAGHGFSSRGYFFDNPRRYDSDDDLAWSVMPQNIQAR